MEDDVKKPCDQFDDKADKVYEVEEVLHKKLDTDMNYRHKIIWPLAIGHVLLQISWLIGIYTTIFHAKWATVLWATIIGFWNGESIAVGAHRGFTHKSFKMTTPLKLFFLVFQSMAGQNSLFKWVRIHRQHHKYSDTDADPHNSKRGFFFSHIGWLFVKRHPLAAQMERQIDMSDLLADKMIMFQYKYFLPIYLVLGVVFPVSVPMYFWNETLWSSFFVAYCTQYVTSLQLAWTLNSVTHKWGPKTYDGRIRATQSLFAWLITFGDGWHNYHHTFPWDHRLSAYGQTISVNTIVLQIFNYLGLAYDLKVASPNVVSTHMKNHGEKTERGSNTERIEEQERLIERFVEMLD